MMTRSRWSIAPFIICALVARAEAGTIRDDVAGAYTTYDANVLNGPSEHDAVGTITTKTALCSGEAIAAQWVLTAAHCVDSGPAKHYTFTIGGQSYTAEQRIPHENWTGDLTAGWDIGLLKLKTPLPESQTFAALATSTPSSGGTTGTIVGFGRTGTGLTGAIAGTSGTIHAGNNNFDERGDFFNWSPRILLTDFDRKDHPEESTFGSDSPLTYEYDAAPGDSGGAFFVGGKLAGIVSLGWSVDGSGNSDYGDGSGMTDVTQFGSWITDTMNGSGSGNGNGNGNGGGNGGGGGPPGGGGRPFVGSLGVTVHTLTAAIPEPHSATLALIAALAVGAIRRRAS